MRMGTWGWWTALAAVALLTLGAAVTAAERGALAARGGWGDGLPQIDRGVATLPSGGPAHAVAAGGGQEAALLRQIAAAAHASAQAQLEAVRQQGEILRLLEAMARGRREVR